MNKSGLKTLPALLLLALPFGAATATADFGAQELRCEYLTNPSGIDVPGPRLSWVLAPAPGVRGQSAYRLLVASSPAILQKDQADLWDSGRVASTQSTWLEYAGKPLDSGQRAYWKVRLWSDAGKVSSWSAPISQAGLKSSCHRSLTESP